MPSPWQVPQTSPDEKDGLRAWGAPADNGTTGSAAAGSQGSPDLSSLAHSPGALPAAGGSPSPFPLRQALLNKAIEAALAARKEWDLKPVADRAQIFLRAADMLSGPHRAEVLAKTMVGQVRCPWAQSGPVGALLPHSIQQTSAEQLQGAKPCPVCWRPRDVLGGRGLGEGTVLGLHILLWKCPLPSPPPRPGPGLCQALPGLTGALCGPAGSGRPCSPQWSV